MRNPLRKQEPGPVVSPLESARAKAQDRREDVDDAVRVVGIAQAELNAALAHREAMLHSNDSAGVFTMRDPIAMLEDQLACNRALLSDRQARLAAAEGILQPLEQEESQRIQAAERARLTELAKTCAEGVQQGFVVQCVKFASLMDVLGELARIDHQAAMNIVPIVTNFGSWMEAQGYYVVQPPSGLFPPGTLGAVFLPSRRRGQG